MKQQSYLSTSAYRKNHNSDSLFRGIWLRWKLLTPAEKVICLGIILIPLWWCIGWSFMLAIWVAGITAYEIICYQIIRLKRPSLSVVALLLFAFYTTFTYVLNTPEIVPRALLFPFLSWGCGGLLLWYLQSHKICVRLHVAAWAFSIVICTMLLWWSFFNFVLHEPFFIPPRNLTATLLDKGTKYDPTQMGSLGNFLVPYYFTERGFGGFLRYTLFFPHPTISSFAIGFAGLIVLDTKKFLWSLPIFTACVFLILVGQARNAWLALSFVLVIRLLITLSKTSGITFIFSLLAISCFLTLSIPSVTHFLNETYTNTVEATSNLRKDSTEIRSTIYLRTWESFLEEPIIGHGVNGSPVLPGYEFALIGTESFIIGSLLYKSGILGTTIFIMFVSSFVARLYKTRQDRPLCCFMMLIYLSLSSLLTEFMTPEIFIILLCYILVNSRKQLTSFGNCY